MNDPKEDEKSASIIIFLSFSVYRLLPSELYSSVAVHTTLAYNNDASPTPLLQGGGFTTYVSSLFSSLHVMLGFANSFKYHLNCIPFTLKSLNLFGRKRCKYHFSNIYSFNTKVYTKVETMLKTVESFFLASTVVWIFYSKCFHTYSSSIWSPIKRILIRWTHIPSEVCTH